MMQMALHYSAPAVRMLLALILTSFIALGAEGKHCGTTKYGQMSDDFLFRIVGGKNANKGAWPWQISLRKNVPGGYRHACGGSIINENWIVTAAHCVDDNTTVSNWIVRVGEYDIRLVDDTEVDHNVSMILVHEGWDSQALPNDIALIKLSRPINLNDNDHVNAVCLPPADLGNLEGQLCISSGWGRLSDGGIQPDILQQVAVPIIQQQSCINAYGTEVTNDMICAGYYMGGKSTCQGDSGGPFVCKILGKWHLVGVTSWSIDCAQKGYPSVYVRVKKYMSWINSKIANN